MTKRTLAILGVLAVIAVVAAVFAVRSQPRIETSDQAGQILFPGLLKDMERVKSMVVHAGGQTMTFDHDDKGWHFRERNGYAVDGDKISALILRLARMSKLENKTAQADRYDRLDLGDPNVTGGQAKQLTLIDTNGKEIANLIVGKRKFTLGGREGGTYVRLLNDPQTWLALGDLMVGDQPHDWLKRDIADIKESAVKRVTVTHPGGEKIIASKASPTARAFTLENMPKGVDLVSEFAADDFSKVLTNLQLDDVAPAASVTFPKDKTITAVIEGVDGFQVTEDVYQTDDKGGEGKFWIRLKGTPPATAGETGDGKTDWARVIADLNAHTDGWVYQVPQYEVAVLTKPMTDLTKKPDPAGKNPAMGAQGMPMGGMPGGLPPGLMQSLHP